MKRTAAVALVVACATAAPAEAGQRFRSEDRETILISRSVAGGFPDGPARNAAIGQDYQLASVIAYESEATDLVAGDMNGLTDVFVVERRRPYSIDGEPWRPKRTRLVSRALNGGPANGPSVSPDISGNRLHRARCVAFVSAASNLVRGDTNGVPDAFVHDLRTRRTQRVSNDAAGRQATGATTEVSIDGTCTRVAYVMERAGARQVYVQLKGRRRPILVSADRRGNPGNGHSYDVSLSRGGRDGKAGAAIAFASEATNLDRRDRKATPDVYLARLRGARALPRLVSVTRHGRAGNGASAEPDVALEGAYVAFTTAATDLLPGDTNGVTDVARASTRTPGRFIYASRSQVLEQIGNGASSAPTTVEPGSVVAFESDASNLQVKGGPPADRNASRDVFYFAALSRNVSLQSRDSANEIPNNYEHHYLPIDDRYDHEPNAPALRPQLSYYGNYLLFDSSYPLIDLAAARRQFGDLTQRQAARMSLEDPRLRQVYLRYIGPR